MKCLPINFVLVTFETPIYVLTPNFMKNLYLLFILLTSFSVAAQSTSCDDANYYLVSAYSHVKSSYDANNISHLKYFANRSVESLKLSKKKLTDCGCDTALELTEKAIILLSKVENEKTYEDGRFFVKQGRELSKESVIAIDKCTAANNVTPIDETGNQELSDLKNEQLKLEQQKEALKLKEAEIKAKLAAQNEKETQLKKEQLVLNYKTIIASNLKSYNDALKICNCSETPITFNESNSAVLEKTNEEIKDFYLKNIKELSLLYTNTLSACKTK